MFYKQIIIHRELPFEVKLPAKIIDMSRLTKVELDAEIDKGYTDMIEWRVVDSETAFLGVFICISVWTSGRHNYLRCS